MLSISTIKFYVSQEILVGHFRYFLKKILIDKYKDLISKKDTIVLMVGDDVVVKRIYREIMKS